MTFNIWPLNIWILQLFLLAVGVGLALVSYNGIAKSWSKAGGILVAALIFWLFVVIAFFKVSELGLLAFLSKVIRNNFFDTKRKFQTNYSKEDRTEILIKESKEKAKKGEVVIKEKTRTFDHGKIDAIEKEGLL